MCFTKDGTTTVLQFCNPSQCCQLRCAVFRWININRMLLFRYWYVIEKHLFMKLTAILYNVHVEWWMYIYEANCFYLKLYNMLFCTKDRIWIKGEWEQWYISIYDWFAICVRPLWYILIWIILVQTISELPWSGLYKYAFRFHVGPDQNFGYSLYIYQLLRALQ